MTTNTIPTQSTTGAIITILTKPHIMRLTHIDALVTKLRLEAIMIVDTIF